MKKFHSQFLPIKRLVLIQLLIETAIVPKNESIDDK